LTDDQRPDDTKSKGDKPQYEKPVVIDLGETTEVQGVPDCSPVGSNGAT
jgi:hypothetical protein